MKDIRICPVCNTETMIVVNTRRYTEDGGIRRRRKCTVCGHRVSSIEISIEDFKVITSPKETEMVTLPLSKYTQLVKESRRNEALSTQNRKR